MPNSDCRFWFSAADLLTNDASAPVALLGAPLGLGSITPGRRNEAPATVRAAMKRMSVYDLETETDLSALRVFDAGDAAVERLEPADALAPIVERLAPLTQRHALTLLIGGNNAVTRSQNTPSAGPGEDLAPRAIGVSIWSFSGILRAGDVLMEPRRGDRTPTYRTTEVAGLLARRSERAARSDYTPAAGFETSFRKTAVWLSAAAGVLGD